MFKALPGTESRRRVFLMRHGEVCYFDTQGDLVHPTTVALTERGERQARGVAELLREVPIDRVITSGLPRTMQTAELVLGGRNLAIEQRANLREISAGRAPGKSRKWVEAEFIASMDRAAHPQARFVNGDRFTEFFDRVSAEFEAILREPGWSNLLIVAHEGTNRMILGWASYGGLAAVRSFEQDPGCLNIVDADVAGQKIQRRFIKLMNATVENHAKHGNNLRSMEQVFDLRRQMMTGTRAR